MYVPPNIRVHGVCVSLLRKQKRFMRTGCMPPGVFMARRWGTPSAARGRHRGSQARPGAERQARGPPAKSLARSAKLNLNWMALKVLFSSHILISILIPKLESEVSPVCSRDNSPTWASSSSARNRCPGNTPSPASKPGTGGTKSLGFCPQHLRQGLAGRSCSIHIFNVK